MLLCAVAPIACQARYAACKFGKRFTSRIGSWRIATTASQGNEWESPWVVLGLPKGARKAEIRKKFRKLVAAEHPDVRPEDPEAGSKFARLTAAYSELMEGSKFAPVVWAANAYDDFLSSRVQARERAEAEREREAREAAWNSVEYWKSVNVVDALGRTVLHKAAAKGIAEECIAILACEAFTEVNAQDLQGATALHFIAKRGLLGACQAMLARRDFVAVNAKEKQGKTVLHWGAVAGKAEVCRAILLCEDFVEVNAKDRMGRSAWNMAALQGHQAVCEVIAGQREFRADRCVT